MSAGAATPAGSPRAATPACSSRGAAPAGSPRDARLPLAGFDAEPPSARRRDVKLCLLGFGSVARAFCKLLVDQERVLAERHGLRLLVTAVGTRHGSLLDPAGMTPADVLAAVGDRPAPPQAPRPAPELLAASGADVLVELTVMGDLSGIAAGVTTHTPAATGHILEAFRLGQDVVTANKGPIAWNWAEVTAAAATAGRRIRFESTVMDGLPVFSLLEFALPDCTVLGFEAVFNATTNFLIDAMGTGRNWDEALAQVQAEGYAEADPSNDVDGWDAASKAAALANVALDAGITPADVERESLRDVSLERILRARADGRRLRLVSRVWREPAPEAGTAAPAGPVRARLRAEELDIEHPLAAISGESLGALLHTDLMADVLVSERHALVPQTAYGVYADLLHLCRAT
jgi:homoserine dehydrogenase